jgi:hypothetical protein
LSTRETKRTFFSRLDSDQTRHGHAGARDRDFLASHNPLEQPGKVRLGLMDVYFHKRQSRLSPKTKSIKLVGGLTTPIARSLKSCVSNPTPQRQRPPSAALDVPPVDAPAAHAQGVVKGDRRQRRPNRWRVRTLEMKSRMGT